MCINLYLYITSARLTQMIEEEEEEMIKSIQKEYKQEVQQVQQLPHKLPTEEDEYTQVFQTILADGTTVKEEIASSILELVNCKSLLVLTKLFLPSKHRIEEVASVSLAFSDEREGYWPVIRIATMKKTVEKKSHLAGQIISQLQAYLTRKYSKTWSEEELKETIQLSTNQPLEGCKLCTTGEKVTTKYSGMEESVTLTGPVKSTITVSGEIFTSYNPITVFHGTIPAHSKSFRDQIPQSPVEDTPINYVTIDDNEIPHEIFAKGTKENPYLAPILIRATMFSEVTEKIIKECQDLKYCNSLAQKLQFEFGRWGLVGTKRSNGSQKIFLCNNTETSNHWPSLQY